MVRIIFGLLAIFAIAVACGGEDEPDSTPTPPPATATPSPAPATPTATPEAVQPAPSMRDFVVDESTTGQDLLDRLSEEENDCIKAAFGEAVYEILRATPLLAATGSGGDSSASAPSSPA
ncbi:MAG: hypothetical protein OXE43_01875 [Chloroflexi bacterium]|nr:hypothetical protein [Chloroflexota bacterium]